MILPQKWRRADSYPASVAGQGTGRQVYLADKSVALRCWRRRLTVCPSRLNQPICPHARSPVINPRGVLVRMRRQEDASIFYLKALPRPDDALAQSHLPTTDFGLELLARGEVPSRGTTARSCEFSSPKAVTVRDLPPARRQGDSRRPLGQLLALEQPPGVAR